MMPYLPIFGLSIPAYTLLLFIAVWAGLWLAAQEARRLGMDGDAVHNVGFYGLIATVLGARMSYVLGNWPAYWSAPLSALSLTPTAFAWPQGAIIGLVVALVYRKHYELPFASTLDAAAPGLALALAIIRFGAFLDGSGFGEPTTLPWGVYLWGEARHPVQLYELAALAVILAVLWRMRVERPFKGYTFTLFVALYAGSRLLLETFRAGAPLTAGGVRLVQPIALVVLLGAVWYLYHRRFTPTTEPIEAGADG